MDETAKGLDFCDFYIDEVLVAFENVEVEFLGHVIKGRDITLHHPLTRRSEYPKIYKELRRFLGTFN